MIPQRQRRLNSRFKLVAIACLVVILIIAGRQLNVDRLLLIFCGWIKDLGAYGPVAFIVIYNLATLLFVPGFLLTLKGGTLFGVVWGSIYALIAATIGATLAFTIGRYLSRDWVYRQMKEHPKFQAIEQAVAREGWKIVLLTRLSPIFPFNLLNYAFGVTDVSLKDYLLGSLGMLPGTVLYVYLGAIASDLSVSGSPDMAAHPEAQIAQWALRLVGLGATIAIAVYVGRLAKRALEPNLQRSNRS
jgi:uncharacterized membrane protein YdjX (TVP38/TMEM64 family)